MEVSEKIPNNISEKLENILYMYNNAELKGETRYGFTVKGIHIHCVKFKAYMDNRIIDLIDKDNFIIAEIKSSDIEIITHCGTDYWVEFNVLYLKGWSD